MPRTRKVGESQRGHESHVVVTDADALPSHGSSVQVLLPHDATAPYNARVAVRSALAQWQLHGLGDDCVLVASELVTNALQHGGPPVVMLIRYWDHRLRLDVSDGDPQRVDAGLAPEAGAESGRGLLLVEQLVDNFGSDMTPGAGKTVHAEWRTDVERPAVAPA